MKTVLAATLAALALATPGVHAASVSPASLPPALPPAPPVAAASNAMGECIVRSTSAADRKTLVRWVFVAFSRHPDLADVMQVEPERRTAAEAEVGRLFERLLAHDCIAEFKASVRNGDNSGTGEAFRRIGEIAFEGIADDPAVKRELAATMSHVDMNRVMQALMRP